MAQNRKKKKKEKRSTKQYESFEVVEMINDEWYAQRDALRKKTPHMLPNNAQPVMFASRLAIFPYIILSHEPILAS